MSYFILQYLYLYLYLYVCVVLIFNCAIRATNIRKFSNIAVNYLFFLYIFYSCRAVSFLVYTDSYRILPISTAFYRFLPHFTDSYCILPHSTDWGVVCRR